MNAVDDLPKTFPSHEAKTRAILAAIENNAELVIDWLIECGRVEVVAHEDGIFFRFVNPCSHANYEWRDSGAFVCVTCGEEVTR